MLFLPRYSIARSHTAPHGVYHGGDYPDFAGSFATSNRPTHPSFIQGIP